MTTTYDKAVPETPTGHRLKASPSAGREGPTREHPPLGGFGRAALTGGLLVAVIGIVEMVAWHLHWTDVLRIRDSYAPMVYNTALALAVTGVAIASAARGAHRLLRVAGGFDVALAVAVLVEHAFGRDLRVDELFVQAYLGASTEHPGRMSVNVALCFVATGTALLIWRPDAKRWRGKALTAAATVVASIAVTALFGYLAGLPVIYGWRGLITMPWPTALSMTLVAASLFMLAFAARTERNAPLSGWIAVLTGAAAFMVTALVWQVFIDMGNPASVSRSEASRAVLFLALLTAGLLALTTWFAQNANRRRHTAEDLAVQLSEEVARRAQAEASARDNEQLLFQFLDAVPVGLLITEPGGHPYFVNQHAATMLGRGVEQTEGSRLAEKYQMFVAGTDELYPMERLASVRALAGQPTHIDDMEIHRPDGHIALEWWGTPVLGDTGEVRFGISAGVDISARRASERALAQQAELLDLAHDVIFIRDAHGRITYWNQGAETVYGWTSEEAVGQISNDLLHTEFPGPIEEMEDSLRRDGRWDGELVQHSRSGERTVVASRWVAQLDPDGAVATVMAIHADVTARKAVEAELARIAVEQEELNVDLQRSNDELEQFAYIASHDLSEPLRAISGPVSLLARRYQGQLDADADKFIGFAVDGCERMQTLINDLLAFSRVGRVELTMSPVDTSALVGNVLAGLQPVVEARHAHVTSDVLRPISGDTTQLSQLFQNLIANAIKFTPPDDAPRIHLGCDHCGDHWRFTVTDNGIGIDERHRERIFGMFKRLHTRDAYPGTGIGLAVCKKIVERHRGTIGVDDGPHGRGCTFWFTIPIQQEARA